MKNVTITNLESVTSLNVNMYEIENAIINGERFYTGIDYTFYIMVLPINKPTSYKVLDNEVILYTVEGGDILIKRV